MRRILVATRCLLFTLCALLAAAPAMAQPQEVPEALQPYILPDAGPFLPKDLGAENNEAIAAWIGSAHADNASEAFRHWDDEGEIAPVCSVCHSGAGFRSFHGLDGSDPGLPQSPIPTGGVVDCATCHGTGLTEVKVVTLPSGVEHPVEGVEAACVTCHQGRSAGADVEEATADSDPDTVDAALRFINPHYKTAAATWLGGYGKAGYHYEGKNYSGRFFHARPVATCVSCHDPHGLEVKTESCTTCHEGEGPRAFRIRKQSYDGTGNTAQGIQADIANNADLLLRTLQDYSAEVAGVGLLYDGHSYPYFFADANGDGVADTGDNGRPVNYASWTPRMLRAGYNWKLVTADPGIYAHNPHYALELLHDSIEDLNSALGRDTRAMGVLR
ncbi:MAG: cytochrome C [Rhodobacteraceae bacterium]|nr:cytochrome C [Paracoccaceae bacterium]MBR9823509.1 cytochrome C [Paracoccaceae bacterium]